MRRVITKIIEFVLVILCILGLADALFLYVQEDRGTVGQFCEALVGKFGANCEKVLDSNYSEVAGFRLTIWGILYYLSLLWISVWARIEGPDGGRAPRIMLAGFSYCGFLISMYLTYLQSVVIQAWCPFCLVSAGVTTLIAFMALLNILIRRKRSASPDMPDVAAAERQTSLSRSALGHPWPAPEVQAAEPSAERAGAAIGGLAILCVLLSAGLVISLLQKRPSEVESALENSLPFIPRRVTPPGGLTYGYDTAPMIVQAFLDYTCPHCRTFEVQTFPRIRAAFIDSGRVRWVVKLLPHADQGAPFLFGMAGICARSLPEARDVERALFAYPIPSPKTGVDALADAMQTGGIRPEVSNDVLRCLETRQSEIRGQLVYEVNQAMSYGLKGPPGFVIDGIAFQGAIDARTMTHLLEIFQRADEK